jgi:hypothetical protein
MSGLCLLGSPSFSAPPIHWRWVGVEAESMCLQVTTAERLLHEMLTSVHQNIFLPIRVSLR